MTEVLHILWNGNIGGAERTVYQLALHQRQSGGRATIGFGQATGHFAQLAKESGIPVLDFALRNGHDIAALRRVQRLLDLYDVHHFHVPEVVLMLASLRTHSTRIYTHRAGRIAYQGRRAMRYRIVGRLLRRFDAITGSRQATLAIRDLYGIPGERIHATFNGVDPALVAPRVPRERIRAKHGVPANAVLVGTAATLRQWKRVDTLIYAAERLRAGEWGVVIVGDGPDRARLEHLAAESAAHTRVYFVGMQSHIGDWLSALDVFVLASGREESFGNAAVEAMAAGLPTIVFGDSPALTEHIIDRETGFVVDTTAELAERLQELIEDPSLRQCVGAAAAAFAVGHYSMERVVERFDAVYVTARTGAKS